MKQCHHQIHNCSMLALLLVALFCGLARSEEEALPSSSSRQDDLILLLDKQNMALDVAMKDLRELEAGLHPGSDFEIADSIRSRLLGDRMALVIFKDLMEVNYEIMDHRERYSKEAWELGTLSWMHSAWAMYVELDECITAINRDLAIVKIPGLAQNISRIRDIIRPLVNRMKPVADQAKDMFDKMNGKK